MFDKENECIGYWLDVRALMLKIGPNFGEKIKGSRCIL